MVDTLRLEVCAENYSRKLQEHHAEIGYAKTHGSRSRYVADSADAAHSALEQLKEAAREFVRAERDERARAILDATKGTP